jgi:hypothetical protein
MYVGTSSATSLSVSRQSHSRSSSTSPLNNKTHTTSRIPKVPMDVREQNIQKLHHPITFRRCIPVAYAPRIKLIHLTTFALSLLSIDHAY